MTTHRWLLIAGAAFAACVATSVPGLALVFGSFDVTDPDLKAMGVELIVAAWMGAFGAQRLRARMLGRVGWGGGLLVAACVVTVGLLGTVIDAGLMVGSVDSGPAFVIGLFVVVAWMVATAVAGLGIGWLLEALARRVRSDLASAPPFGEARARIQVAKWLLAAAGAHLVAKGSAGGPVIVAVATFAVACAIATRARRLADSPPTAGLVAAGWLGVVLGLAVQSAYRWHEVRADSYAEIPFCIPADIPVRGPNRESDVLARRARQVDGIADAASDYADLQAPDRYEITLYVLPVGGGPLPSATRGALESAVLGMKCAQDNSGKQPKISVKEAASVPIAITAKVRLEANADLSAARARVLADVAEAFDPRVAEGGRRELIRTTTRSGAPQPQTVTANGIRSVEYMADGQSLYDRIVQLPSGSVPVVQSVEVEVVL